VSDLFGTYLGAKAELTPFLGGSKHGYRNSSTGLSMAGGGRMVGGAAQFGISGFSMSLPTWRSVAIAHVEAKYLESTNSNFLITADKLAEVAQEHIPTILKVDPNGDVFIEGMDRSFIGNKARGCDTGARMMEDSQSWWTQLGRKYPKILAAPNPYLEKKGKRTDSAKIYKVFNDCTVIFKTQNGTIFENSVSETNTVTASVIFNPAVQDRLGKLAFVEDSTILGVPVETDDDQYSQALKETSQLPNPNSLLEVR